MNDIIKDLCSLNFWKYFIRFIGVIMILLLYSAIVVYMIELINVVLIIPGVLIGVILMFYLFDLLD